MSKVFTQLGRRQDDGLFMFYIFHFAGLATLVLLLKDRMPLTKRDVFFGVMVGIPNFLSSRLLLAALTQLPAFLVYPSYSVGGHPGDQRGQLLPLPGTAEPPPDGRRRHDPGGPGAAQSVTRPLTACPSGNRSGSCVVKQKRRLLLCQPL